MTERIRLLIGDCRESMRTLMAESVQCCVTSPPYWGLRDYGHDGQLGLEKTPEEYVANMVEVFREVRRVLRNDGVCWLNLGDSYANTGFGGSIATNGGFQGERQRRVGHQFDSPKKEIPDGLKPKDLCLIPWRVVLALQADGWWVRSVIAWVKKSCMPESVRDRPTNSWEPIFLLAKSAKYFFDNEAIKEPSEPSTAERGKYGWNGKMVFDENGKEITRAEQIKQIAKCR